MSVRNLDKLFNPASVALIGATTRRGAIVARNLRRAGFGGRLFFVDPDRGALDGVAIHPDVGALPEAPDLAVIATPPGEVPSLLAALGARGTRAVVVTAGLGDLGEGGRGLRQAILAAASHHLLRVLGPGSLGLMVPGIGLDASTSSIAPRKGDLAFVSQSGAMISTVLDWAAARGIGFSHVVSLGEMADVDVGDVLDYLGGDGGSRAILLYVEHITEARKFMSAARAAARAKPVLALKAGRFADGTRVPAQSDAVYDAAFRRAGVLRVAALEELLDAVETLAETRSQQGDRLAVLTNGGGPGTLALDALIADGGTPAELAPSTIPRHLAVLPGTWSRGNPVDILDDASGARYADALKSLLEDRGVDAVLVLNAPTALARSGDAARAVIDTITAAPPSQLLGRNVLTSWLGGRAAALARRRPAAAHIATYDTPDSAVRGFLHRVRYRRNQELLMETPAARMDGVAPDAGRARAAIARALAAGRPWLDPGELREVLSAYGIPYPTRGGVQADMSRLGAIELIVGLVHDPVFGPAVLFGRGGTAVEQMGDVTLELPPLNAALARAQMARTKVWRLMQGHGDGPPPAIDAVVDILLRVAQLAIDHAEVRTLDVNPLLVDGAGVIAVAARLGVARATTTATARLAISPYPKELEGTAVLPDRTTVKLRPIRPEDEPLLQEIATHMSLDDLRLRFFTPIRRLTHELAARLSQLDYDREMALVALTEDGGTALGVARFAADPDNRRAEYAIGLRSDWKGRGLGHLLMTRLMEVAARRGIGALDGDVLRENDTMLQVCRDLGFAVGRHPDDAELVRVSKRLAPAAASV
jgi:acyl-CoA synthetase (NDP forming)/GNAT superfamily N-acetyltransferase